MFSGKVCAAGAKKNSNSAGRAACEYREERQMKGSDAISRKSSKETPSRKIDQEGNRLVDVLLVFMRVCATASRNSARKARGSLISENFQFVKFACFCIGCIFRVNDSTIQRRRAEVK